MDIILLSCVAGAIRSFLQKCRVQYPDDILVCIRTDVRPQHTKLRLDNKFSLAFIKLPVGTEGKVTCQISFFNIDHCSGFKGVSLKPGNLIT